MTFTYELVFRMGRQVKNILNNFEYFFIVDQCNF